MEYVKKMCILRQVKQGFSGDGKALSGLIKVEQYGKNLSVEVSVINFAPLAVGEYYCILSDAFGKTETLALRGKSLFNILSDLDVSRGFCGVICFVKQDITPVAYGVNGNSEYDWKRILDATLPPTKPTAPQKDDGLDSVEIAQAEENERQAPPAYDDEKMANEDYYKEHTEHEQEQSLQAVSDALVESGTTREETKKRTDFSQNADAENVRHPFETDGDGYYLAVKSEIDELFSRYPKDDTLCYAFASSEWVRVQNEDGDKQYLVGVVYEDAKAKYICYALPADDKEHPPKEIEDVCSFVPYSLFDENQGYFVIFQSATTGECIKPKTC